jgi:hypothetical protein
MKDPPDFTKPLLQVILHKNCQSRTFMIPKFDAGHQMTTKEGGNYRFHLLRI